jgi:copper chaperone NosL
MKIPVLVVLIALVALSACGRDDAQIAAPREPDSNSVGYFCRMGLGEHAGPKGQILPKGWKDPLWFSSVRDALTYVEMEIVSEHEIAGFWVNDMAQGSWEKPAPGSWIDARHAWYVLESRKTSGMGGSEAVPFKLREAAQAFAEEHGGRVAGYAEAKRSVSVESPPEGTGET